jgi:hypothetical protein
MRAGIKALKTAVNVARIDVANISIHVLPLEITTKAFNATKSFHAGTYQSSAISAAGDFTAGLESTINNVRKAARTFQTGITAFESDVASTVKQAAQSIERTSDNLQSHLATKVTDATQAAGVAKTFIKETTTDAKSFVTEEVKDTYKEAIGIAKVQGKNFGRAFKVALAAGVVTGIAEGLKTEAEKEEHFSKEKLSPETVQAQQDIVTSTSVPGTFESITSSLSKSWEKLTDIVDKHKTKNGVAASDMKSEKIPSKLALTSTIATQFSSSQEGTLGISDIWPIFADLTLGTGQKIIVDAAHEVLSIVSKDPHIIGPLYESLQHNFAENPGIHEMQTDDTRIQHRAAIAQMFKADLKVMLDATAKNLNIGAEAESKSIDASAKLLNDAAQQGSKLLKSGIGSMAETMKSAGIIPASSLPHKQTDQKGTSK